MEMMTPFWHLLLTMASGSSSSPNVVEKMPESVLAASLADSSPRARNASGPRNRFPNLEISFAEAACCTARAVELDEAGTRAPERRAVAAERLVRENSRGLEELAMVRAVEEEDAAALREVLGCGILELVADAEVGAVACGISMDGLESAQCEEDAMEGALLQLAGAGRAGVAAWRGSSST